MTDEEPFAPARRAVPVPPRAVPVPPRAVQFLTYESLATDRVDVLDVLRELTRRPAWMADALCREHPELDWHPERGVDTRPHKAVCACCSVRAECLSYALEHEASWSHIGIWGGTSGRERRQADEPAA